MTHKEEICYWAKQPDNTKVWCRYRGRDWELSSTPGWVADRKYIVDDAWAELRKAQTDGKQLQYYLDNNKWIDAKISKFDFVNGNTEPKDWRIKQEEAYEWQWICQREDGSFFIPSKFFTSKEDVENYLGYNSKIIKKYKPSKRIKKH